MQAISMDPLSLPTADFTSMEIVDEFGVSAVSIDICRGHILEIDLRELIFHVVIITGKK